MTTIARRTKRRYAHELYPHAEEGESRPLEQELPYLYARWHGLSPQGTSAFTTTEKGVLGRRISQMLDAQKIALLADALYQGLVEQEAWDWVTQRQSDESGELAWERALRYGVNLDAIKPYPCGDEPDRHYHTSEPDARGHRFLNLVHGKESECDDCTEPVGPASPVPGCRHDWEPCMFRDANHVAGEYCTKCEIVRVEGAGE